MGAMASIADNVDQVPFPSVINQDRTYEESGSKQLWVSQPSSGLDRCQATLQLCIHASGEQIIKPAMVSGGGGNVAAIERLLYDKWVDVYFQKSAWMDHGVNMEWVDKTLVPCMDKSKSEKVLFADNVSFQLEKDFHERCRKVCVCVWGGGGGNLPRCWVGMYPSRTKK